MAKGKLWIILLIGILLAAFVVVNMKKTQPLEDLTQRYDYVTRLTHSENNYGNSVWSPDGSNIFFQIIEGDNTYIYVMNSNGSNQKKLAQGRNIALSPDGSKVFFYRNNSEFWVMNADGSNLQKLSQVSADSIKDLRKDKEFSFIREYFWSPDQTKIILYTTSQSVSSDYPWIRHDDGTWEHREGYNNPIDGNNEYVSTLWMWDVKGGFVRKIISSNPLPDYAVPIIAWSHDGKSFIFSFFDIVEGLPQVPIYNVTVGYDDKLMLTSLQGAVSMLDISPDGKNILYTHSIVSSTMSDDGDIWVMNMDGSGRRQLTDSAGSEFGIWSPDGKRIAYLSYSGDFGWFGDENKNYKDSSKIWVMNADGSDKQLLLSIPFPYGIVMGDFYWSPDGSKLVFGWIPNQQLTSSDIYLIDVPATAKKETS
jgi:Tol biopolymer transport system component